MLAEVPLAGLVLQRQHGVVRVPREDVLPVQNSSHSDDGQPTADTARASPDRGRGKREIGRGQIAVYLRGYRIGRRGKKFRNRLNLHRLTGVYLVASEKNPKMVLQNKNGETTI
jgi:hypothetical protein